jgi:ankyrin repeat protein
MTAAIQTNNLDALRGFIHHEKLHLDPAAYTPVTNNMQLACEEAARLNHCDAMNLLLDNGCTPTTKVIFAALEGKSTDILDTLISRGWSINSSMGHAGDALM